MLSDGTVQEALLAAVRAKMKEFQYTPEHIPFELFQNADDAVVEYLTMQCLPHPQRWIPFSDSLAASLRWACVIVKEALNKAGRMRKFLLVVPKWADDSPAIGRPSGKIHTGSPSGMLL